MTQWANTLRTELNRLPRDPMCIASTHTEGSTVKMNADLFVPQALDRELASDEVHIWRASLDQPLPRFRRLRQVLSRDEGIIAERLHFEKDRKRFISGRGILRTILGSYLRAEPSRLQFCYGKDGKPELSDTLRQRTIRFNLSRSEGIALYAFTRDREIGVDIEHIRSVPEMEHIAERFFAQGEKAVLRTLPGSKKREAFFACWTRKEAFIKAIGDGLSCPLGKFEVSLVPGEPARLLGIEGDSEAASQWSIRELEPAFGFAAAFAVRGRSQRVRCWQWAD